MALKIKPGLGTGDYDLLLDGEQVGRVHKKVERYNLRRSVTTVTWLLYWRGQRVSPTFGVGWITRKDAVAHAEGLLAQEAR